MKKLLFLIAIFCVLKANAQTYSISFAGTGASTTVNTVKVENLTAGTSLTLSGSDILRLTILTSINSIENGKSPAMKIYPNPMTGNSILQIYPPKAGSAIITVFEMSGKLVAQIQSYLENYPQEFRLSGINKGFYLISVKGSNYQYSGKLLCNGKADGTISIHKISNNQAVDEKTSKIDYKGTKATVDMQYSSGDRLKITGISGNYSTVKMEIPASDKTITFNFLACTDGDNNNYPVVEIGTQTWIAENLKTTKYNDGTAIPNITVNTAWAALTTGAYSDYNNTPANSTTYGRLYNWYAVDNNAATKVASNGGKNVCPTGWHVPTDTELTTLTTYLGGESVASGKLKETGTTHWASSNTGATNETGFTALPGGYRYSDGSYAYFGLGGYWWSSTEHSTTYLAWYRGMYYNGPNVGRTNSFKQIGISVRCVRDF